MQKHTSLYLDLLRVMAAFAVFFSHITREKLSGGNQFVVSLGQFGQEGVAIFFVISGIVIAYVSREKEHDFRSYIVARLGRLWSVMLPALVLTVILDSTGRAIAPGMYESSVIPAWGFNLSSLWNFLSPALFLNKIAFLSAEPGTNGPFWSLCFEFWYYILFAIAFYLKGLGRVVAFVLAAVVAGPGILILFPIWALGLLVYKAVRRPVHARLNIAVWAMSSLVLVCLMVFKYKLAALIAAAFGLSSSSVEIASHISHFAVGAICAINIVCYNAAGGLRLLQNVRIERVIRYLAARSFSLYLYQAPCLFFFGAITYHMGFSLARLVLVIALSLIAILLLAEITETRKKWFVIMVDRLIPNRNTKQAMLAPSGGVS
jgi:peptidoglycan/LPS O-acetylase OafA/YrhL